MTRYVLRDRFIDIFSDHIRADVAEFLHPYHIPV